MRRIGFRRMLPIVLTLIHVVLIWFAQTRQSQRLPHIVSQYRPVAFQEGVGVPPMEAYEPSSLNPVQKIALILELPTMFLAILIGAFLLPRNETAWMYLSIPLLPLVWYAIGRWLDGLLGYTARLRVPQILRGLLSITALGVLMVSMAGVTPLNHHRTPETYWVLTSMALWSGLCISMMLFSPERVTRD